MATINIAITASVSDFSTFADELGYQDTIFKTPEELAILVEPISIQDRLKPNPQDKTAFLLEYFQKEAKKVAMRTAINSAVSVTVA
jgi:hypothetical protein